MAAYVIAEVEVVDAGAYEEYKSRAAASLAPYKGRYLARGGAVETLEGTWNPHRIVILEFPSAAHAKAWWNSESYRAARAIRQEASRAKFIVVEGLAGTGAETGRGGTA